MMSSVPVATIIEPTWQRLNVTTGMDDITEPVATEAFFFRIEYFHIKQYMINNKANKILHRTKINKIEHKSIRNNMIISSLVLIKFHRLVWKRVLILHKILLTIIDITQDTIN
jgi:hypothetical protein